MNAFFALGRWIFPLPFAIFGLMHCMNSQTLADDVVPDYMPFQLALVWITGIVLLLAAMAMWIGKFEKLAAFVLAILLLLVVILVDVPGAMRGDALSQISMWMVFKDLGLMAGALLYGQYVAKKE